MKCSSKSVKPHAIIHFPLLSQSPTKQTDPHLLTVIPDIIRRSPTISKVERYFYTRLTEKNPRQSKMTIIPLVALCRQHFIF